MTTEPNTLKPEQDELKTAMAAINKNPVLQSLLYDLNLLPEVLATFKRGPGSKEYFYMISVIGHFLVMESQRTDPALQEVLGKVKEALQHVASRKWVPDADTRHASWIREYIEVCDNALALLEPYLKPKE